MGTRGMLVVATGGAIYRSVEFNGDQYPDGYGMVSYRLMQRVSDMESFRKTTACLVELYGYEPDEVGPIKVTDQTRSDYTARLELAPEYFRHWSTDYLYFKNLEATPIIITCGQQPANDDPDRDRIIDYVLKPGEVAVFNFGYLVPKEKFTINPPNWVKTALAKYHLDQDVQCGGASDSPAAARPDNNLLWDILKDHIGHSVEIACYGDWNDPANICLEDTDTNEVILDAELYTLVAREDAERHVSEPAKIYTHDEATRIVELFENLLGRYNITVPSDEDAERGEDNSARLYGTTYADLLDTVEEYLVDLVHRAEEPHVTVPDIYSGTV